MLGKQVPDLAPVAIDAGWQALIYIYASTTDNLNKQVALVCNTILDAERIRGNEAAFLEKGFRTLPAIARKSISTGVAVLGSLIAASQDQSLDRADVARALHPTLRTNFNQSGMFAMPLVEKFLRESTQYPEAMSVILDVTGDMLKDTARTLPPLYIEESIALLLKIAGNDTALRQRVIKVGQDVMSVGDKTGFSRSEKLVALLTPENGKTPPSPAMP